MDDGSKLERDNHGWVFPRPDGAVAKCGGPGLCAECAADAANVKRLTILPDSAPIMQEVMPPYRFDPKRLRSLAFGMYLAMTTPRDVTDERGVTIRITGAGIAAPQVGQRVRMFVMERSGGGFRNALVAINPVIVQASTSKFSGNEMCLSSGGLSVTVRRSMWIIAQWTTLEGTTMQATLREMQARVFQHEFDHLNGVRIADYAARPIPCDDDAASPAATVAR